MKPTHLRCELREGVPLLDCERPRFGWALEAEGRDRRQTGYRILIAASPEQLAREEGCLWDSGEVASAETVEIEYAGPDLPPAGELLWTVRVRDQDGAWSPGAEPRRFRTGLARWDADWIFCERRDSMAMVEPGQILDTDEMLLKSQPVPFLRRSFELSGPVKRATLYATARGLLEMQVNGRRAGASLLAPGWTDYDRRIEYAAEDVTESLRVGENVIGCILGDGWYAGFVGEDPKRAGALYGTEPELLCELHVELVDGGVEVIRSDGSWRGTAEGPIRYSDLLQGERYDARRELPGWSEPGFEDGSWPAVRTKPRDAVALVAAKGPPIRVTEDLRPVAITEVEPGVHIFDLGRNMVGRVRLRADGAPGAEVRLRFGEALQGDGSLYTANLGLARQTDFFVFGDDEHVDHEPRFTIHGFRYVEVTGLTGEPSPETITGRVIHSDTPWASTFECSSEMVDRLYGNITWGQRGNFVSVPTDCPQRNERYGWLADAQVFLPTASLNADVAAFMAKWGDDVIDAQSPEGAYPDVAPRGTWDFDGAPGWADAGIIVPALLYERYADRRLLERHWPHMERYMEHLLRRNPDLRWKSRRNHDFGDWLSAGEDTPKELLATAFWANDARLMARIARVLGKPEAERYERLLAGITAAFGAAYVGEDALVEGDTQTGYLLALAFELLPPELRARAAERLVANIERHDWHLTTGFIGVGLLCPVLTAAGHADVAHRLLLQDTYPSWGYSIKQGATTIWERWDGYTEENGFQSDLMNSFNHYSLGSVGAWLIESVVGIRSATDAVAYDRVLVEPVPGTLTAARGSYRSVRGEIASEWTAAADRFGLTVTIPPNVEATVVVPARGDSLSEGGEPVRPGEDVRSVTRSDDAWQVEVGSGRYEFVSS